MKERTSGEVVTFYSYKGGTGRTMSMVNLACLLADRLNFGERILLIDWDLEAPGLHRYFHSRRQSIGHKRRREGFSRTHRLVLPSARGR